MLVGFSFFFVFFFLFLFLPQIGLSVSTAPFFPFLLSFFFLFFFLPQSWCLAFLNSLYLLILLKPKPKPICLKLLSQINGSLSLAYFFFVSFCAYGVVDLPWWGGERGFVGIGMVEGVGLWWSAFVVEFWWWHKSEFGSVDDGLHDCSMAGSVMVGGWIEVWWWVSVAEIGVWWWVSMMAQIGVWW